MLSSSQPIALLTNTLAQNEQPKELLNLMKQSLDIFFIKVQVIVIQMVANTYNKIFWSVR